MNTLLRGSVTMPHYRKIRADIDGSPLPLAEDDLGPLVPVEHLDATELGFLEEEVDAEVARTLHAFAVLRARIARRRHRIALDDEIKQLLTVRT